MKGLEHYLLGLAKDPLMLLQVQQICQSTKMGASGLFGASPFYLFFFSHTHTLRQRSSMYTTIWASIKCVSCSLA